MSWATHLFGAAKVCKSYVDKITGTTNRHSFLLKCVLRAHCDDLPQLGVLEVEKNHNFVLFFPKLHNHRSIFV